VSEPLFQRIEELFHNAIALEPQQRAAYLDRACAGDATLRAAVEELLYHDRQTDSDHAFLASPVANEAAQLRQDPPTLLDPSRKTVPAEEQTSIRIPGYVLLEELGRGGMGVVYKARQTSLNRIVALKMLLPASPLEEETLTRFRTEAETLARLHHPNIVPIYDHGSFEGRPFFTMEYVAGPSLALLLEGRPQDHRASASLIEILARAIHDVHQLGIIHRDLKPANILLAFSREPLASANDALAEGSRLNNATPKITDFGLAKDQNLARNLTQTGTTMGTPLYMAPEQARGKGVEVGPEADIYSLGSILYEMLTGRPPFDAPTPAETLAALLNEEPVSPSRLQPKLPRDLATICLRCLQKSPRRRYASAHDLAEDLSRFLAGKPIQARPVGPLERTYRWCRRRPLVASLVALSCLLAASVFATALYYDFRLEDANAQLKNSNSKLEDALSQLAAKNKEQHKQIIELNLNIGVSKLEDDDALAALLRFAEVLRLEKEYGISDHEQADLTRIGTILRQSLRLEKVINLDRKVVCFAAGITKPSVATLENGRVAIRAVLSDDSDNSSTITFDAVQASLSSDGRLVTLQSNGAVEILSGFGKPIPLPLEKDDPYKHALFHSGRRLVITESEKSHIKVWDVSTNELRLARERETAEGQSTLVSHDGRWCLTIDKSRHMELWETETGKTMPLVHKAEADGAPLVPTLRVGTQPLHTFAVSPDSRHLALFGTDNHMSLVEMASGQLLHGPVMMHESVDFASFSPDGARLLAVSNVGVVQVWNVTTGQPEAPPLHHLGHLAGAAFINDSKHIITVAKNGMVCLWSLPETVPAHQVASAEYLTAVKEIAGARDAIALQNGKTVKVKAMRCDGVLKASVDDAKLVNHAVFSLDGQRVAVAENETTVGIFDVATGKPLAPPLHHKHAVHCAAFSPNGKRLITATTAGTARVWDTQTGELLTPPLRHGKTITRVLFSPSGDYALLLHEGNKATAWDLTPDQHSLESLLALAQIHSGSQINDKQEAVSLDSAKLHAMWKTMQGETK
jgi:serine/threonine protein kinase/WD40 repeat protein